MNTLYKTELFVVSLLFLFLSGSCSLPCSTVSFSSSLVYHLVCMDKCDVKIQQDFLKAEINLKSEMDLWLPNFLDFFSYSFLATWNISAAQNGE